MCKIFYFCNKYKIDFLMTRYKPHTTCLKCMLLILAGLSFFSCVKLNSETHLSYRDFPQKNYCVSSEIILDTVLFRYPFRIKVFDEKAIVLDLHNPDHYYHLFSYPDFKPVASFGRRGNAPGEVLSGENIIFKNCDTIYTLDSNKNEIQHWSLPAENNPVKLRETITLDNDLLRPLDFTILDDSTFLIPDYSGNNRFCFINNKGEVIARHGQIVTKNAKKTIPGPALAQAWRSFVDYNPKNKVLAMVTQLGEVLEIYHLNDTLSHFTSIGPHGEPTYDVFKGHAIPAGIMGFSDVFVADRYIYTVFHGQSFKEISLQGNSALDGGKYIYVFDLKGSPVCKIELDRNVYAIYPDESTGKLIALDVNSDQPILEYKLPDALY